MRRTIHHVFFDCNTQCIDEGDTLRIMQDATPADRLRRARESKGFKTPTDAARYYGWTVSTYVSHENGTRGLKMDAAVRYGRAFGVSASLLLGLGEQPSTAEVPVVGEAAYGVWRHKALDVEQSVNRTSISVPADRGSADMRFCVKVIDESVNKVILPNEFAICVPFEDEPQLGTLVYVERRRGELVERSIRRVSGVSDGKTTLSTHSNQKNFLEELSTAGPDAVQIMGRVIGKFVDFS